MPAIFALGTDQIVITRELVLDKVEHEEAWRVFEGEVDEGMTDGR